MLASSTCTGTSVGSVATLAATFRSTFAELALEVPHAGLPRVVHDDVADRGLVDLDVLVDADRCARAAQGSR